MILYPSPSARTRRLRSRPVRRVICSIRGYAAVLLLAVTVSPASALPAAPAEVQASVSPRGPSQPADGTLNVSVTAEVTVPTDYLEIRLQLLRPAGRLVYQKTEIRRGLDPGAHTVAFVRELEGLGVRPGRYPLRVRVRASGGKPVELEDRLFVYDPARPPLSFVPVLRFTFLPAVDPVGSFVLDPASLRPKREADRLLAAIAHDTAISATVAMPPLMIEEWRRAADGYRFAGPEGLVEVGRDEAVPRSYARSLTKMRDAVEGQRLELLDVPYADPDVAGLASVGAVDDLEEHYDRGSSLDQATFGTRPAPGTMLLSDRLPVVAAGLLASRGMRFAVLPSSALSSAEGTPAPGVYPLAGSELRILVPDHKVSSAMRSTQTTALLDTLFERYSEDGTAPTVGVVDLGFGSQASAQVVAEAISAVADAPWTRLSSAEAAAKTAAGGEEVSLPARAPASDAPAGYWGDVREARRYARALIDAVGEADPEADAAMLAMLVSESRAWAGPDGGWGLADRGRAFAGASLRQSRSLLSAFSLSCEDVMLSGERGEIPVQVRNDSGKTMTLTVDARARGLSFPNGKTMQVRLRPQDNFLTIPVDLGAGIAQPVSVTLRAGDVVLARAAMTVRASYLERLFVVASIVLVLVGMLLAIRHKVRSSEPYNDD